MSYYVKLLAIILLVATASCGLLESDDEDDQTVSVDFVVKNQLLWHIGHDYKVSGTDKNGKTFESEEKYIEYFDILIEKKEIKKGSKITLLKNGSESWTSDPVTSSGRFFYTDSAFGDEVEFTKY